MAKIASLRLGRPTVLLARLAEKPKTPPSRYAPAVFEVMEDLKPGWRGELEVTDAIQLMLEHGYEVGYEVLDGWWFDVGKSDDILTSTPRS
jgi:glucose-1-phosphate thymidylyltransferase